MNATSCSSAGSACLRLDSDNQEPVSDDHAVASDAVPMFQKGILQRGGLLP